MAPDVSRGLARFIAAMGLGHEVAQELAARYATATELPDWLLEVGDPEVPDG